MNRSELREQIRRCLHPTHDLEAITGDFAVAGMEREERTLMPAAVLVPLVERTEDYTCLLYTSRCV